jgi:hypothetical protein
MPVSTSTTAPGQQQRPLPGEALTRRAVTVITATIAVMSTGTVTQLCLHLGITAWTAWLVGPAVDLSVVGLLLGIRFLSQHGYTDDQLLGLQRTPPPPPSAP